MPALFLTADLMFTSQSTAAARQAGGQLQVVSRPEDLVSKAAGAPLVLIDLSLAGLEVAELVAQLRLLDPPPQSIIAFGPHVHEGRLQSARDAGCDRVMSRGQFHAQMGQILAEHLGK